VFMTMVVTAGTLLQAYVFWRAASVPAIKRWVPWPVLIGLGVALWATLFLSFYLGHGASGAGARALELFGMTWLAVLFLAFAALLVTDLLTGFGFGLPKRAPVLRGWALLAAGVLSVIALVQGARPPVVRDYEVHLDGLPPAMDSTVLVALSDLHLGSLLGERWLAARVAQVQALRPDIVVLLGDLLEGHGQAEGDLLADFKRLSAPLGVWAVTGNHESHGGRRTSARLLEETGFHVLHDRWAEVRPGFVIAGVDDLTSRHRAGLGGDPIRQALGGRPAGATILLSHTPWDAEKAAASGAGLMLCGHTHGGQIWPFDYLTRIFYPLLGGRYVVDGMPVIVCRGTGTWGPRMRLWRPSELLRVTLRRGAPAAGLRRSNR
jgi:predicted MPP superfamily phosphohydrolase